MAHIRKRSNGKWQATIYAGRDANGKQDLRYVTCDTERECKREARRIEQELDEGRLTNIPNMRLSAWIDQWLEINKGRLSPSTYALYKSYAKNHYKDIGHLKLNKLNETILTKFLSSKISETSKTSARRMMSALKKMLADAMKHRNPAIDIKLPEEEKVIYRIPTDKEMEQIHSDIIGTRDEPIILLAAWCGLRRGEIFALKWDDINWRDSIIRIDEGRCVTEDNEYVDKRPKSENGVREVVAPEYLMDLLSSLKKSQMQALEKKKKRKKKDEPLEEKNIKTEARIFEMRPDSWSSYFTKLVREKCWPKITFHNLRHYHASWLYDNNIPDQYAADRLGHDVKILKTIYQHLGLDRRKEIDNNIRQIGKKMPDENNTAPEIKNHPS